MSALVGRVARRYARAAFELAVAKQDLDGWARDLDSIRAYLGEPNVALLLENPSIPFGKKREMIEQGLRWLDPLRRNFVFVLVLNGRVAAIEAIAAEFQRLLDDYQGVAVAEVTTAVPLDDAEARRVAQRLEALIGKTIVLERRVDPSILGGVVARVGDRLIDGSIAGQLAALRAQLSG